MKKILFLLLTLFTTRVMALDLTSYSKSAIMIEPTTNTVIYELNKDERLAPASMTKLMTMLLIMESIDEGKINLSDTVLISENASGMGGSQVFLEANSRIEVEQLLKGIAIASGNDAAVAMAEHIAGSTSEFVNMMNKKVKDLGLKNTHFVNVHGLDADNHYSTAYDMAMIARELLTHKKILEYTSLYEDYLVKPDGTKTWLVNTNKLVRFYEGVDGLKTGYTSTAKYCLTSTANKNNIRFITVVKSSDIVSSVPVYKGKKKSIFVYPKEDVTDLIKQNEDKKYSYNIDTYDLKAPVRKGDVVGQLEIVDNSGKVVRIVDLVSKSSVEKHNFISMFGEMFRNIINGYV